MLLGDALVSGEAPSAGAFLTNKISSANVATRNYITVTSGKAHEKFFIMFR